MSTRGHWISPAVASLSKRKGSQYWQVRYRDPLTTKPRRDPTRYRWNDRLETRQARELCARKTYEEKASPRSTHRDRWQTWVREFFERDYHGDTLERYLTCWRTMETYLTEHKKDCPAHVDHSAVSGYLTWRRDPKRGGKRGKIATKKNKPIAPGTIALEVKVLRLVMNEAIKLRFASVNPCIGLALDRTPLREMHEITLDEEKIIRAGLAKEDEWMQISFDIAMAQGCRSKATRLPLAKIDLLAMSIEIRSKGKVYETALNPALVPLITRLKAEPGRIFTWDLPARELRQCPRKFTRFFRKIGLGHIWFHCTRATAITRAHRMGVDYALALAFFKHSSWMVHLIYTRLGIVDVSPVAAALASYASSLYNRCNESADSSPAIPARAPSSFDADIGKRSHRRQLQPARASRLQTAPARSSAQPVPCS